MKRLAWLALAGLLTTVGCGSDDTVKPSPDYATDWVGEYEGTGSFLLSNGVSGVDQPIVMSIVQADPKHVTIQARLTFGTGRTDFAEVFGILEPNDPDQITLEQRLQNSKTVFAFTKDGDTITGSIVTSTLRIGGNWSRDVSLTSIVANR